MLINNRGILVVLKYFHVAARLEVVSLLWNPETIDRVNM